jgi:hypothetical protein
LELFEAFPNVGMVTARPYRASQKYSEATFEWAHRQGPGVLTEGVFLDWETGWEHWQSVGVTEAQAREDYAKGRDYRLVYQGKTAFIGASHFQFMARRELLQRIIPLPSEQPMRGERGLDIAVNEMGFLRLTTEKPFVAHMGNRLPGSELAVPIAPKRRTLLQRILWLPGIRHFLLWLNNRIFRLYFFNVE